MESLFYIQNAVSQIHNYSGLTRIRIFRVKHRNFRYALPWGYRPKVNLYCFGCIYRLNGITTT